jgi:TonB family protein
MFEQRTVPIGGRRGRWFGGTSASIAVHLSVVGAAVLIAQAAPARTPRFMKSALTYMALSAPPSMPYDPPVVITVRRMVELAPKAPVLEAAAVQTPLPELKPAIQPQIATVPGPKDPAYVPKLAELPKPAPQVAVGSFANSDMPSRTMNANRQIDRAGFDAPAAQAIPTKTPNIAAVGSFETASNANPRPGTDRPVGTLIAEAGFGRTTVAATPQTGARAVGDAGFGSAGPKAAAPRPAPQGGPTPTGFDASPAATMPKPVATVERVSVPVQVLFKPTPAYTSDARTLKIEGDVALEVDFCASGQVRVVRVIRGLGHGLDEAAASAAEHMQFKPAQSASGPIDFRAVVHITFRLT